MCVLGIGVAVLAWFSGNSAEIPPELWEEISVAAKLRPPRHEFPALWQVIISGFSGAVGVVNCISALKPAGAVSLGVLAAMAFRLFSECIPGPVRSMMDHDAKCRWIGNAVIAQGVLFWVCSDPVWLAGRVFSPEILRLLLAMGVFLFAVCAVKKSSVACMIVSGALAGFAAADTPLMFLPPVMCAVYLYRRSKDVNVLNIPSIAAPFTLLVTLRRTALAFSIAWIVAVVVNLSFYRLCGGGGETDTGLFIAIVRYVMHYVYFATSSITPMGCLIVFAVVVMPAVIISARMKHLTDLANFLSAPQGFLIFGAGMFAFLQSTGFSSWHFWRWREGAVSSAYLLCLCMLVAALTAMSALCVFAVEIYFRNHRRLVEVMYPDAVEDEPLARRTLISFRKSMKFLRTLCCFEPVLAVALVIPFRFGGTVREMSSVVNDAVRQTVAECGDAPMVFTDGALDAAIETIAAESGRKIKALSMMSGPSRYDRALRTRGETDEDVRRILAEGAADALRSWVRSAHPCASNIALQVGFELWRHDGLEMPRHGGFVSRTAGFPAGEIDGRVASARKIADRILSLYARADPAKAAYPELNRLFLFVQWRLSRMCRMRANEADRMRNAELSEMEQTLADELDAHNPEWMKIQERMDWIGRHGGMRLTPREGLRLGLGSADYRRARNYAREMLAIDSGDVEANFALAMCYFVEKQYGRAEKYFRTCLVRAPDEPAVLNNLAIVLLRMDRLDEAEKKALHALEVMPDSHEIKTTLHHIRSARSKSVEKEKRKP